MQDRSSAEKLRLSAEPSTDRPQHRSPFKVSEVPSPVFGMQPRKEGILGKAKEGAAETAENDKGRIRSGMRVEESDPFKGIKQIEEIKQIERREENVGTEIVKEETEKEGTEIDNRREKRAEAKTARSTDSASIEGVSVCTAIGFGSAEVVRHQEYRMPPLDLLERVSFVQRYEDPFIQRQKEILETTLHNFHVDAKVIGVTKGPTVTRYEVQPAPGVKVNKITNLADDIKLSLAAKDIRIEAPIPGRSAIGIEVPNRTRESVVLRRILQSQAFLNAASPLTVALGVGLGGEPVVTDIKNMPHGLIAGATGSGKSVCINAIIISLLYKAKPSEVKLLLIDPKMVELAPYNDLPHLVTPVVTDPKQATAALKWAVEEMERRYELFVEAGARDIERYNRIVKEREPHMPAPALPYLVVIVDELADLMMVSPQDVEESICRIAQKARACGIHLLLATQRPSVDVITGLIKANIPTRIAFSVSSHADSRTILDMSGAEKLLGKGDMLFLGNGMSKPVRLQGNFVSDAEIERVTSFVKKQAKPDFLFDKDELKRDASLDDAEDELFPEALRFVIEQGQASASALQRRFRIGYNRAARLIDMMENEGFVSGQTGSKPRTVLLTKEEFATLFPTHSTNTTSG
ncbi:hypothetical protein BSNK01_18740 [Bacillaceae bacterium]